MSRPTGLKRLRKVGMSRRVESSKDQESLRAPKDASKQGRSIKDIDADVDVTLVDETQKREDDDLMFDTGVLEDDEMPVEAKVDGKGEQSTKPEDKSTAGEAVTAASVESTVDTQPSSSKDKGKGIMIEPEVPLKRKDQIALDEQIARDIQAKLDDELLEEQKLARKQEKEIAAERLPTIKGKEELQMRAKSKNYCMELMEKRRKHFSVLRAQEKRNRPPTKAQKRTQMSTYLKHMGGYTYKQLKGTSFDEIQKLFDKEMKRVNTFVATCSKVQESKEKKVEGREETAKGSRKKMLGG
ncbi:hypothetical protein Tco_0524064 [Tanacetum coccineum]